jgi:predicted alpha/beta-fold hydrolase
MAYKYDFEEDYFLSDGG